MKKLLLIISIFFGIQCSGQGIDSILRINGHSCNCPFRGTENKIFDKPQQYPSFPAGEKAWKQFMKDSVKVDFDGEKEELLVGFVVHPDGSLSDIRKKSGVSDDKFQEAKRVLLLSGKWCPGMHNGRCVLAYHTVVFSL
jgi:hypothetical protein